MLLLQSRLTFSPYYHCKMYLLYITPSKRKKTKVRNFYHPEIGRYFWGVAAVHLNLYMSTSTCAP